MSTEFSFDKKKGSTYIVWKKQKKNKLPLIDQKTPELAMQDQPEKKCLCMREGYVTMWDVDPRLFDLRDTMQQRHGQEIRENKAIQCKIRWLMPRLVEEVRLNGLKYGLLDRRTGQHVIVQDFDYRLRLETGERGQCQLMLHRVNPPREGG